MNSAVKTPSIFREFWHKCQCPSCKIWNWVYETHSERHYTGIADMLALKCWKCGESHWFSEETKWECEHCRCEYDESDNPLPVKPEDFAEKGTEFPR